MIKWSSITSEKQNTYKQFYENDKELLSMSTEFDICIMYSAVGNKFKNVVVFDVNT